MGLAGSLAAALLVMAAPAASSEPTTAQFAADARAIETLIAANYAYLDRFPGGRVPYSSVLEAERDAVHDRASLLRYAEHALLALADHHAITGSALDDSWAVVPSYADLWIEYRDDAFVVDAVRADSPAAAAGIAAGDRLTAVGNVPVAEAVASFWRDLGLPVSAERAAFAARVLAAGRRDRPRVLTILGADGHSRTLTLPNLYAVDQPQRPPLTATAAPDGAVTIRINNALGDPTTIVAFDAAMASIPRNVPIMIDLTDTPSGGDTTIARAILGWFVSEPTEYQMHNLPSEMRETGIARQWVEQVLPRAGKHHEGPVSVLVGRWTGSMGEGLAIGFAAIGAKVQGDRMAGLRGAIYDLELPASGLTIKLPAERLMTVSGVPREAYVPAPRR